MMKISVITVCFNNLKGLQQTVNSVISQTCQNYEYIIIDGGSTDGTKEYLQKTEGIDSWVSEPDKGIYNAMNKGIKMAQGEYCIFMNSGDTFYDHEVLEKAAAGLNGNDFYVGNTVTISDVIKHKIYSPIVLTLESLFDGFIYHQSTFTKTTLLKKQPYNENIKISSDWEFFITQVLLQNKTYGHLDFFVANFFLDGISFNMQELVMQEREEILKKYFPIVIDYYRKKNEKPLLNTFERKIQGAMKKPPLSRDIKILRNSFKFLFKDLYIFCFQHHKYKK